MMNEKSTRARTIGGWFLWGLLLSCTILPPSSAFAEELVEVDQVEVQEVDQPEEQPAAVSPTPIAFLPPLSLTECIRLIQRSQLLVPEDPETPPEQVPLQSLDRMILTSYNYLSFRDDLHTSAANYDWEEIARGDVEHEEGEWDTDTFTFDPPIRRTGALSMSVRRGDAWVRKVRVWDEKGNMRDEFPDEPALLLHSLPRRQVFHLWRRTTVSRIEIEYSRSEMWAQNPRAPRVMLYAGTTYRPELVKTAMYRLDEAREHLQNGYWPDALFALEEAEQLLGDHIRRFRPELR